VFGDVIGDSHRAWNEKVCAQHGLTPVMPVWGEPTAALAREFLHRGGEARLVTVRPPLLDDAWLGTAISEQSLAALARLGVDPAANSASFTPWSRTVRCFASPLQLVPGERVMSGRCWAIDFTL
jgi:diphthamide synthase (EF-2-diphthine--ammonia ligase)